MRKDRLEMADVCREFGPGYLKAFGDVSGAEQRRVIKDIILCRTQALGGHALKCNRCGHSVISYNSCRNRHCPKCQAKARADWLEARAKDLLDVSYFHVVFTIPDKLGPLALQNKRKMYGILFRATSETLLTLAKDQKHLGAEIGFMAVLHTWGQKLQHHPHIHCVIPGGGISLDGKRWVSSRKSFIFPVRVISRLFKRKFLSYLNSAYRKRSLSLCGKQKKLEQPSQWRSFVRSIDQTDWNVYAKPPFNRPKMVLKYLARYTHRVAITNQRLIAMEEGKVVFRWKDRRQEHRYRTLSLHGVEFLRRFLQHVLPKGFMHIRHFGFLSNRVRRSKLALCRRMLKATSTDHAPQRDKESEGLEKNHICPLCKSGQMERDRIVSPDQGSAKKAIHFLMFDTW